VRRVGEHWEPSRERVNEAGKVLFEKITGRGTVPANFNTVHYHLDHTPWLHHGRRGGGGRQLQALRR
jgi:hypothetical protein